MITSSNPEVQAILDRVMSGDDRPPPRPRSTPKKPRGGPKGKKGPRVNSRKANWDWLKKLYTEELLKVGQVAERTGMSRAGVIYALKQMKVYEPKRDYTRRNEGKEGFTNGNTKEFCSRGHPMKDAYVYKTKTGWHRDCRECHKQRQRDRKASMTPEKLAADRARRRANSARRQKTKGKRVYSPEALERRRTQDREYHKKKYQERKSNGER